MKSRKTSSFFKKICFVLLLIQTSISFATNPLAGPAQATTAIAVPTETPMCSIKTKYWVLGVSSALIGIGMISGGAYILEHFKKWGCSEDTAQLKCCNGDACGQPAPEVTCQPNQLVWCVPHDGGAVRAIRIPTKPALAGGVTLVVTGLVGGITGILYAITHGPI